MPRRRRSSSSRTIRTLIGCGWCGPRLVRSPGRASSAVGRLLGDGDDRFVLLAGTDRLAPLRQRSLAATVEWSYRLLDAELVGGAGSCERAG
jgi:hypothetical protein